MEFDLFHIYAYLRGLVPVLRGTFIIHLRGSDLGTLMSFFFILFFDYEFIGLAIVSEFLSHSVSDSFIHYSTYLITYSETHREIDSNEETAER